MDRYTNEWILHNPQLFSHLWKVARFSYLKHYHLSPGDAVQLFTDLNIQKAFAVHFGTFHLSMENGDNQVKAFLQARQSLGARAHDFILPNFGAAYMVEKKR